MFGGEFSWLLVQVQMNLQHISPNDVCTCKYTFHAEVVSHQADNHAKEHAAVLTRCNLGAAYNPRIFDEPEEIDYSEVITTNAYGALTKQWDSTPCAKHLNIIIQRRAHKKGTLSAQLNNTLKTVPPRVTHVRALFDGINEPKEALATAISSALWNRKVRQLLLCPVPFYDHPDHASFKQQACFTAAGADDIFQRCRQVTDLSIRLEEDARPSGPWKAKVANSIISRLSLVGGEPLDLLPILDLSSLAKAEQLQHLYLEHQVVADTAGVAQLTNLQSLEWIGIMEPPISPGTASAAECAGSDGEDPMQPDPLFLYRSSLSPTLAELASLTQLISLKLRDQHVETAPAWKVLLRLRNLRELQLAGLVVEGADVAEPLVQLVSLLLGQMGEGVLKLVMPAGRRGCTGQQAAAVRRLLPSAQQVRCQVEDGP
jgi:hypothetical protein